MKNRSIRSMLHPAVAVGLLASLFTHRTAEIKAAKRRAIAAGQYQFNGYRNPRHYPQRFGLAQVGWRESARQRKAKNLAYLRRRNARRAAAA